MRKKAIFFHGYGGEPIQVITDIFKYLGYDMIQPYIDFDDEWDLDRGKSLVEEMLSKSADCDLIIGLSLGGYLADLVANNLGIDCILINPGIDKRKSQLHIKDFDCPRAINNCNLEVYLGGMDFQIPNNYTLDYLKRNNIDARIETLQDMGHVFNLDEFIEIVKMSNFIKINR